MTAGAEQSRKDAELKVLGEALARARKRGGESRRLVDRIRGEVMPFERPDFLVWSEGGGRRPPTLTGIEHFRVDHFSELEAKKRNQGSLVVPMAREVDRIIGELSSVRGDEDIPSELVKDMGEVYGRGIEARMKASHAGFVKAMNDAVSKHAGKAGAYRENIEAMARDVEAKLAFLVEVHSDFSDVFINGAHGVRKLGCGEAVLFDGTRETIEAAGRRLDYLILAFYPAFTDAIVDAMVINCRSMKRSLERNGIGFLPYFGADKHSPLYGEGGLAPIGVSIDECGNGELEYSVPIGGAASEAELAACIDQLPQAVGARRSGTPFAADLTMQMLLDVFGHAVRGSRLSPGEFARIRNEIGEDAVRARVSEWQRRWLPNVPAG